MPPRMVDLTDLSTITGIQSHSSRRVCQSALIRDVSVLMHVFKSREKSALIFPSVWDDSLDSSHDASSGLYRRPLQPVDDNITFNNSSAYDNSVDSAAGKVGVGFKSRNAKEDTFDALFADVKLKPVIRKPKLFLSTSGDPYSR